jgi:hypothetical protein
MSVTLQYNKSIKVLSKYFIRFNLIIPSTSLISPCHQCTALPQVADGGTASNMEGTCEYIEEAVADSRQGVVLQLGGWTKCWQLLTGKTRFVNIVRVRRVVWLQTPTVFWVGGWTISLSYSRYMGLVMLGRHKYTQQNHKCLSQVPLRLRWL